MFTFIKISGRQSRIPFQEHAEDNMHRLACLEYSNYSAGTIRIRFSFKGAHGERELKIDEHSASTKRG